MCVLSLLSRVRVFVTPWTVAHQAPLLMRFPRQKYWSGLPFPSPGDLPNPGMKPMSYASPALAGGFFFFFFGRQILYHWATWDILPFRKPGHGEATTSLQLVLLSFILSYVRRNTHILLLSSRSRFLVGITYSQSHCKHPLLCSVLNLGSTGYYVYIYQHNPGTKLAQQSAMVLWWVMPLVYW